MFVFCLYSSSIWEWLCAQLARPFPGLWLIAFFFLAAHWCACVFAYLFVWFDAMRCDVVCKLVAVTYICVLSDCVWGKKMCCSIVRVFCVQRTHNNGGVIFLARAHTRGKNQLINHLGRNVHIDVCDVVPAANTNMESHMLNSKVSQCVVRCAK